METDYYAEHSHMFEGSSIECLSVLPAKKKKKKKKTYCVAFRSKAKLQADLILMITAFFHIAVHLAQSNIHM